MSPPEGVASDVPFSWRIKDYLEELRVQAQYITGAEGEPGKQDMLTRRHKWVIPVWRLLDN